MGDLILEARDDAVLTLTLNQPERRNPVSDAVMVDALCDAVARADRDLSVRCIVLTGAGSAFSSGGDLRKMAAGEGLRDREPAVTRRNYVQTIQRIPLAFQAIEVPVIAAINGPAIGAGLDLALLCDIRLASEHARFAASFVKLGIAPGSGGAWLLPRIVGVPAATELLLTGRMIDATEALRIGLIGRLVPAEALLSTAQAVATEIAANPPHGTRMTKRLLHEGGSGTLANNLAMAAAMQAIAHATADNDRAIRAFLGRGDPDSRGSDHA